ncbi:kinase-like domain-containing protein [Lentinula raphanica]|nr:kinase-like domain-containing protein [Lentinula raphanica]
MDNNGISIEQVLALRQKPNPRRLDIFALNEHEEWWIQHFDYLKEHGYLLRPRYRPGWKPSYNTKGRSSIRYSIMDALRISDSLVVAMKRVKDETSEAQIATFFSDDAHNSDPRNHCVRILDIFPVPGLPEKIIVMAWMRKVMNPRFRTVGEGIQFLNEMVEGLQYMHQNNVAHRDCAINNMAMEADAIYDWSGPALHHSRTRRPPRYYLIDFGYSQKYDPSQPRPLEYAIKSGGFTPPEGLKGIPCDPFSTDIFILGSLIHASFLDGNPNPHMHDPGMSDFEFLRPLVEDMVVDDPAKRPTMDEVASRFSEIIQKVPWWKLRARAAKKDEFPLIKPFRAFYHVFWTASMMLLLKPAIFSPKPIH